MSESRALVQGALVGLVMRYLCAEDSPVLVDEVRQDRDGQGDYLPYFTVTMRSGTQIKVAVDDIVE